MTFYCKIIISLPLEAKRQLLYAENVYGLRPIEVAVMDGQLGMFNVMFDECNVYRFEQGHVGMHKEVYYDVTEYECWRHPSSRRAKSPLTLLRNLSYSMLENEGTKDCFSWHVMNTWLHVKFRMNMPLLILWFFWRVGICVCLYFVDFVLEQGSDKVNNNTLLLNGTNMTTNSSCGKTIRANLWQSILMTTYCSLVILLDIYEFASYIRRDHITFSELVFSEDKANHHFFYR